jgi:hypothetical protein
MYLSIYLSIYVSIYISIQLSVYLPIFLSIYPPECLYGNDLDLQLGEPAPNAHARPMPERNEGKRMRSLLLCTKKNLINIKILNFYMGFSALLQSCLLLFRFWGLPPGS